MSKNKILIVEDETIVRQNIRTFLVRNGHEIAEAESCQEALALLQTFRPNIVISDYLLGDGNALHLLAAIKGAHLDIPFIILTGHGSVELAVQAIKMGAEQFLIKPVELQKLSVLLEGLLENQRKRSNRVTAESNHLSRPVNPFMGTSPAIRQLAQKAEKLLFTGSSILLQGETGTGKGVLAVWLHKNGSRRENPLVDLNCSALSRELLESELFGHEKGAFTGAVSSKTGLFEAAHGGTIFLDEIGDMDLNIQPKLLKALEEKRFRRLGGILERVVDVRLITATHKDLHLLVRESKFRSDLYFRISALPLRLPPLRERVEDIPILARHMLIDIAADLGRNDITLSPDTVRSLKNYTWPGNIRELRNTLERAALLNDDNILAVKSLHFEPALAAALGENHQVLTLSELERQHIEKVLRMERGRVEVAARKLELSKTTLYEKIKRYRINYAEFRNLSSDSELTHLRHAPTLSQLPS
ncbi:MAG: sigma-54-dependent Fis family transcriptional regulator [Chloracidobacterium sp.]|nr:sigma-54-dependent Fis family transcriptional regulator [Chloracidobacterium sp.]